MTWTVGADDRATPRYKSDQIADCGHSSTLEQPEAVTALLRDFLVQNA
jgi:hypothetical protein